MDRKKLIPLIGICILVIASIPPSINAQNVDDQDIDYDQTVKIGDNTYLTIKQIYAGAIFYTALENHIDFNIAVKMAVNYLKG